ncbi:MAG TPA: VraH family protein [Staphylococcus sp.]|nr:VraH family protein [Staphylococcus sp.]
MSIKQFVNQLLKRKLSIEDLIFLVFVIFIASIFTSPLFGIPIGIIFFCILFLDDNRE